MSETASAEAWVRDPDDLLRRNALRLGMGGNQRLATPWVALAAGWSGGNVGPSHAVVPASPEMTPKAVRTAILVALAGGILTDTGAWYRSLRRPSWKPPDWAFGPVWTVIFALTATSAVLAWNADAEWGSRAALLAAYAINAVLNVAWSGLFFTLRRPDWAFVEVLFLWLSIAVLIIVTGRVHGMAALLLLPYLLWVGIAACLNRAIVRLNGPFRSA